MYDKNAKKQYLISRCRAAEEAKLPEFLRGRPLGNLICILLSTELIKPGNLTQGITEVILNSENAAFQPTEEEAQQAVGVYIELSYTIDKIRFVGTEPFISPLLTPLIKMVLRYPRVHGVEVATNGNTIPSDELLQTLKNRGVKVLIDQKGEKCAELSALFENECVYSEEVDFETACERMKNAEVTLVGGKLFKCPFSAEKFAAGEELAEEEYVDLLARQLQIPDLKNAVFEISNQTPFADCSTCKRQ